MTTSKTAALRLYRRYMDLSRRWPLDPTKGDGRDLGALIRTKIATAFPNEKPEDHKVANLQDCELIYAALDELASNKHMNDFPKSVPEDRLSPTAIGVLRFTRAELAEVTSEVYMRESGFTFGNEERVGFWKRWKYLLFGDAQDMMGQSKTVLTTEQRGKKKS